MYILWNNLIDSGTITASTVALGYPKTWLQDSRLVKQWKTTSNAAQWVTIDMGSAVDADTFALINHNFTKDVTITIQGNTSDSWSTPAFTDTIAYDSYLAIDYFSAKKTYRYWHLKIDDPTNTNSYLMLGRIYLCMKSSFSNPAKGFDHTIDDTTLVSKSISGQYYADKGVQTNVYTLAWGYVNDTTKKLIQTIYARNGMWDPVIVVPDPSNTTIVPPIYAVMQHGFSFAQQSGYTWNDAGAKNSGMIFQEVL